MALTEALYAGEKRALRFLKAYRDKYTWMPSCIEMCEGLGWSSPNAAADVLNRLEKKGALVIARGKARCIRIVCDEADYAA